MRTALVTAAIAFGALACGSSNPTTMPAVPRWTLSGTVRSNGAAISSASVVIRARPVPALITQTITDASGRYVFPLVDEGSYFVEAGAAGYVTVIMPVMLNSSQTIDFDLPLNPVH